MHFRPAFAGYISRPLYLMCPWRFFCLSIPTHRSCKLAVNASESSFESLFSVTTRVRHRHSLKNGSLSVHFLDKGKRTVRCICFIEHPRFQECCRRIIYHQLGFWCPVPALYPAWPAHITVRQTAEQRVRLTYVGEPGFTVISYPVNGKPICLKISTSSPLTIAEIR